MRRLLTSFDTVVVLLMLLPEVRECNKLSKVSRIAWTRAFGLDKLYTSKSRNGSWLLGGLVDWLVDW
jgi:hypothetical protein